MHGSKPMQPQRLWHWRERGPTVGRDVVGIKRVYHAYADIRRAASYINDSIPKRGDPAQRCRHRCAGSPGVGPDIVNSSCVGRLEGLIKSPEVIDLVAKVHRRSREVVVRRLGEGGPGVGGRIVTHQVVVNNETISQAATGIDKGTIASGKVTSGAVRHRRPLHPGGKTERGWCRRRCCACYGSKDIDPSPP